MHTSESAAFGRRPFLGGVVGVGAAGGGAPGQGGARGGPPPGAPSGAQREAQAAQVVDLARAAQAEYDLRAVLVRVLIGGEELVTAALGESMTGVPATPDMHFRNGSVAIAYMAMLLLRLVDQGRVRLDDRLATWLPALPHADRVTLRMLASMTAGYRDYVQEEQFQRAFYADPFRPWTPQERLDIALSKPNYFEPGTNFGYAHTNYVILGLALEQATGRPVAALLRELILDPLGLRNTQSEETAAIRAPALHAFSSERREYLGVPPSARFYEESTFWNPSWTLTRGAIQTTTIADMAASAVAFGEGTLLSPASHRAMVDRSREGFGAPVAGCPVCATLTPAYNYGLGVIFNGAWLLQSPQFGGYGGVAAYLPARRIALAVATTYGEGSFDASGGGPWRGMSHRSGRR